MKLRSLVLAGLLALPLASSNAQVGISVNFAPPVLPVYEQPPCPVAGYMWTPGYWGWDNDYNDYYWVPGAWVPPPSVGLLWTPAWWGWNNGAYVFNQGYWGPTVGFYGGINYGYGYTGNGYWGGRWSGNTFQYNTAVTRVNKTVINNTYVNNSFTRNVNANRASFNGPNGIKAQPTAQQKAALTNAKKVGPTSQQLSRQQAAMKDQNLRASVNKGKPNADAIKTFNKNERGQLGQGGKGPGAAAGGPAGAGKGGNKPGNMTQHNRAGAGAGQGQNKLGGAGAGQGKGGKRPGAAGGPGAGGNKPGNMGQHNRPGAGAGNKTGANGNKIKTGNQRNNMRTGGGNQARMHTGNMGRPGGQPRTMNQMSHNPQMKTRNAQMGGAKHPQMSGGPNRARAGGPQAGGAKKPQGKQEKPKGHR